MMNDPDGAGCAPGLPAGRILQDMGSPPIPDCYLLESLADSLETILKGGDGDAA